MGIYGKSSKGEFILKILKIADPDKFVESEGVKHDTQGKKDATRAKNAQRQRHIEIIQNFTPAANSILCIGARDDSEVLSFIKAGFYAIGIDVTPESIYVREMDAHKMTFGKNTFDFIYASHILEHLHNPLFVMHRIKEISKHGVFIVLPIVKNPGRGHPTMFNIMKDPPDKYTVSDSDFDAFAPSQIKHYRKTRSELGIMFIW